MTRILYLHGSQAGPYGPKTDYLKRHGHEIVGNPRLPFPRHPRLSWRWLSSYLDQAWFRAAVQIAQESYYHCRPDIVFGSSMGGAVAMNLSIGDTPLVLMAPAWRVWFLLRFGNAYQVKPRTVVVHGGRDRTILPQDSRTLLANSRSHDTANLVGEVEQGLRNHLKSEEGPYRLEGRLVLVQDEGHRCNSDHALLALQTGVEVLAALHQLDARLLDPRSQ